jgi:hypothetical protein
MKNFLQRFVVVVFAFAAFAPVLVRAQAGSDDLRNTIQSSVLSDPRVANIPPDQLQSLIDALVAQAQAQHMTSADILFRPQQAAVGSTFAGGQAQQNAACMTGWQGYLCQFNQVFGFEGGNYEIPIFLLVTTAFLIAVIWELIIHHRKKMAAKTTSKPASAPPAQPIVK